METSFEEQAAHGGMYVMSVVLTEVQGEFGITRSNATLPYTATMIGFGIGGIVCGRWADRHGVSRVVQLGAVGTVAGYLLAGVSANIVLFTLAHADDDSPRSAPTCSSLA
jgi:MFS family permease